MACVVAWEEIVCSPASGTQLVLLLGAFLLAYHACLRFGDLQRVRLSSLSLTAQSLRGICWSTKTSRTGQPFAVTLTGLSGRCTASSWCLNYLLCLHRCWLATEAFWNSELEPDFLLPVLPNWASKATTDFAFRSPMSYSQALPALRACMQLTSPKAPNTACSDEGSAFTIHSLKVGLLSAAKQQRLPEDARRTAGHRKSSAELYGRDDTVDSLWLQTTVSQKVADGWRPSRPIARGGQAPTTEPPFSVPRHAAPSSLTLAHLEPRLRRFLFRRDIRFMQASSQAAGTNDASDDSSLYSDTSQNSSDEDTSPTEAPPPRKTGTASDINSIILANGPWGAVHLAHIASDTQWRTACGILIGPAGMELTGPAPDRMCHHKACRLALDCLAGPPS